MCRLFVGADPDLWEAQTRSIRLDGMCTSVRLEHAFWELLEEIGRRDGLSLGQLLTRLARECGDAGHDLHNFASFLRVCCARYQALQLTDDIPSDSGVAIASLDAPAILARERRRRRDTIRPSTVAW